jgi:uncharacterized protein (DUF2062 family)
MKKFFKQFFLINDTPHNIAAGAALGVFLGIAPGAGIAASVVLASIFRFNRLAAIAGAIATNTWTLIFALPLAAAVGCFMVGGNKTSLLIQFNQIQNVGFSFFFSNEFLFNFVLPLTLGFVVVSGAIALFCYILTFSLIKLHRKAVLVNHSSS